MCWALTGFYSRFSDSALYGNGRRRNAKGLYVRRIDICLGTGAQLNHCRADIKYGVQKASPNQRQTDSAGNLHRDRVGERLEWLSQQLKLTEDQKKQLKPVLAGEFKQMRAVGEDVSLTQDQKREKMKQIHEASRPQVRAILTPEQRQKFAQMKEEAKERRGDKKDKGQSPYQPPQ
jgi:protein CpxP